MLGKAELLPNGLSNETDFIIRIARTEEQLRQVTRLRYQSYSRTIPSLKETVNGPDSADYAQSTVILLAEDRATGSPLATVRIEVADDGYYLPRDLLDLPDGIPVEATSYYSRLAACSGRNGTAAKLSIVKAAVRYSLAVGKHWVLAATPPGRARNYRMLGLKKLTDKPPVAMPGFEHIELILLGVNLFDLERTARDRNEGFLKFLFSPASPEIEVFSSVKGAWLLPRAGADQTEMAKDIDCLFGMAVV